MACVQLNVTLITYILFCIVIIFVYNYIQAVYSYYFTFYLKKNAKNYSLIIFYFFLSLISYIYKYTNGNYNICKKKNIYGHILYIHSYIYLYMRNFVPDI